MKGTEMKTVHQRDFQLQFGTHLEEEYYTSSYGERERYVLAVLNVGWDTPPAAGDAFTLTVEDSYLGPTLDVTESYAAKLRFSYSTYLRLTPGGRVFAKVTFTGVQPTAYWSVIEL